MTTKTVRSTPARSTRAATAAPRGAKSSPVFPEIGDVEKALKTDLARIRKLDPLLAKSALAASCRTLAKSLDSSETSATAKSMCARALLDTLDRLRELTPDDQGADDLDDLATRRKARLARGAAAENQ